MNDNQNELLVFNPQGELFLQHRPKWKSIQPNRWDTAVGGHVDWGETIEQALQRETSEEIGLTSFFPTAVATYIFESPVERELVHVFKTTTKQALSPSAELDGGRYFSEDEIRQRLGTGFFTPNFEQEWQRFFGKSKTKEYDLGEHAATLQKRIPLPRKFCEAAEFCYWECNR